MGRPIFWPRDAVRAAWVGEGVSRERGAWDRALGMVDWRGAGEDGRSSAWVYKAGRRVTVWRARIEVPGLGEREAVLKAERVSGLRRVWSWLQLTKAWRQMVGAGRLRAKGVPCTPCLAIMRGGGVEVFIGEWIEGPTLLSRLAARDRTLEEDRRLAEAWAELFISMIEGKGPLFNLDHKPSNLVVTPDGLAVIDTLDITTTRSWTGHEMDHGEREEMVASSIVEAVGCGYLPRRTVLMRAVRACWERVPGETRPEWRAYRDGFCEAVVGELEMGGEDHLPKDDPLAGPWRASELV